MNCILAAMSMIMFLLPFTGPNAPIFFIVAFNIAWAGAELYPAYKCYGGECPEVKIGIYLLLLASGVMLVMAFIPDV